MKKLFRWLLKFSFWAIGLFSLFLIIISYFAIPISLNWVKEPVEKLVGSAIHREVKIEKSIIITTSLKPAFSIEGVRILNPDLFKNDTFMYLDKAIIRIELLPLLKRKLHIAEFGVHKLDLTLERVDDTQVNWIFTDGEAKEVSKAPADKTASSPQPEQQSKPKYQEAQGDSIVVKNLYLDDISVTYFSPEKDEPSKYELKKCSGEMLPGKPLDLSFSGQIDSFPYSLNISLASLEEFLNNNRTWINLNANIAETNLEFAGDIDLKEAHRSLALQTSINGDNLSSLNGLLGLDLPPFAPYQLKTSLSLMKGNFELKNLTIATGSSILEGTAIITRNNDEVFSEIALVSELVQLDDFLFDDWSWQNNTEEDEAEEPADPAEPTEDDLIEADTVADENVVEEDTEVEKDAIVEEDLAETGPSEEILKLADPEFLKKFDLLLEVKANQVLSGNDNLGNGYLNLLLKEGRLAVEPLKLNLPGGDIEFSASVKPGKEDADAAVKIRVENFDIGILARRKKPDTDMSGFVNLEADLTSTASSLKEVLANGNGYFDFSGQLKNINAGLIDLWAVNLVSAIVAGTGEKESQVNCAVCRWTVKDGILTPDVFFIDTTKIRICGKGQVDFKNNHIDLTVGPSPKRPEFFNLATPLRVRGTFSDINFAIKKGALVGHVIAFITSPVHVPIRRLVKEDIPADGSDACNIELGPDNRTEISIQGCR